MRHRIVSIVGKDGERHTIETGRDQPIRCRVQGATAMGKTVVVSTNGTD
jgi:hypothetical protein